MICENQKTVKGHLRHFLQCNINSSTLCTFCRCEGFLQEVLEKSSGKTALQRTRVTFQEWIEGGVGESGSPFLWELQYMTSADNGGGGQDSPKFADKKYRPYR